MTEQQLIKGCKAHNRASQKALYDWYAPRLLAICYRYLKERENAEDVLMEGMYKVFSRIDQYSGAGSFEGWMKRIIINECLMFLRRKPQTYLSISLEDGQWADTDPGVESQLFEEDIMALLERLPTGYRTIFNLYVIDGYKHHEIAEQLKISINTSKSQLIHARRKLAELVKKNNSVAI